MTLTYAGVEAMLRDIKRLPVPPPFHSGVGIFGGIRIVENDFLPTQEPVLQVRGVCPMTPAGRASMNAWLLERFGMQSVAYMCSGPFGDFMAGNPEVMRRIVRLTQPSSGGE